MLKSGDAQFSEKRKRKKWSLSFIVVITIVIDIICHYLLLLFTPIYYYLFITSNILIIIITVNTRSPRYGIPSRMYRTDADGSIVLLSIPTCGNLFSPEHVLVCTLGH